jgi:hypothetical protein
MRPPGDGYLSEAEEGDEEDEGGEGEEEDLRRWDPPEEGEEFVEPDPELRRIAPGSLPVYQRGISTLPDLEDWRRTVGEIVLIVEGDT